MELTGREEQAWMGSRVGEIVPAGNHLVMLTHVDAFTGDQRGYKLECEWFAFCPNLAEVLMPHPILGYVASCVRCAALAL